MTTHQKLFCECYLANGFNARQAYFEAFPLADKTNKQPSYPYSLLKEPHIKEYIEKRRQEIYESLNIDAERIAIKLSDVAFAAKDDDIYTIWTQLKAIELLQKQLGLQNQKIEAKVETIEVSLDFDEEVEYEDHSQS